MKRTHIVSLMTLVIAIPAAAASSYFAANNKTSTQKPCFATDSAGYEISGSADANYIVRVDNASANPSLRMQIVDDPAAADFVLVDDGDIGEACEAAPAINSIRIDPAAARPDLTVALSHGNADYKIYVHSANYTEQDAAALFAVIWQNTVKKTTRPPLPSAKQVH